jgi:hypothetical protein
MLRLNEAAVERSRNIRSRLWWLRRRQRAARHTLPEVFSLMTPVPQAMLRPQDHLTQMMVVADKTPNYMMKVAGWVEWAHCTAEPLKKIPSLQHLGQ